MITIYIPTRGRAHDQITWKNLTRQLQENTIIVADANDDMALGFATTGRLMKLPVGVQGIGEVRQYIVDHHDVKRRGPKVLMLDDDLRFFVRREDDSTKFLPADPWQRETMVNRVDELLNTYAHAGILAREGGNRKPPGVEENTRLLRALAYDVSILRSTSVKFNRLVVMEDFDVALQLLRRGYKSACLCDYVQDQTRSNAPGGCSLYRTLEKQAEGARGLRELHGDFVKVVEKETKVAWNGAKRLDVQVRWKDAYASSQRR